MSKLENLKIFEDEKVGKKFLVNFLCIKKKYVCFVPSLIHGRSVAIKLGKFEWLLIKGGGWNYNGPTIYQTPKKEQLIYGVYDEKSAKRELEVSNIIKSFSSEFGEVLAYVPIKDLDLPKEFSFLEEIYFNDENLSDDIANNEQYKVNPCLLLTKVKCPYRVADLMYLKDGKKNKAIKKVCSYLKIKKANYIKEFAYRLGKHVGILHKHDFINDTLEFSNVTLLAEILDYEWMTTPGIDLKDNTEGYDSSCGGPIARRIKELLYGAEIVLQLSNFLHRELTLFEAYKMFIDGYKTENNDPNILNHHSVTDILNHKKISIIKDYKKNV